MQISYFIVLQLHYIVLKNNTLSFIVKWRIFLHFMFKHKEIPFINLSIDGILFYKDFLKRILEYSFFTQTLDDINEFYNNSLFLVDWN